MKSLGSDQNVAPQQKGSWKSLAILAAAALPLTVLLAQGCKAGSLDCAAVDGEPGTADFCKEGGGGKGGMGATNTGGASGACDVAKVKGMALPDCADHGTVADYEKDFLHPRCGKDNTCHYGPFAPKYKEGEDIFPKLVGKTSDVCGPLSKNMAKEPTPLDDKQINTDDPLVSLFYTKVLKDALTCPSSDQVSAGGRMPYSTTAKPEDPLTDPEIACIKNYVEVVAANCKP